MPFHCYLAKKITITQEKEAYITRLAWSKSNNHDGYLTAGLNTGNFEILRMNDIEKKDLPLQCGILTPPDPIIFKKKFAEHLEQHSDKKTDGKSTKSSGGSAIPTQISHLQWNNIFYKLTTADNKGLIIVWNCRDGNSNNITFEEDMINKRDKCTIKDLSWSIDGSKIAIVYSDNYLMVGNVNGAREMSLDETTQKLVKVSWGSNDNSIILLGTENCEVHAHSAKNGAFIKRVRWVRVVGFSKKIMRAI